LPKLGRRRSDESPVVEEIGLAAVADPPWYLSSEMQEQPAHRHAAPDRDAADSADWHKLAVANPTFLLVVWGRRLAVGDVAGEAGRLALETIISGCR
jgi:hypothetical protein